VALSGNGWLLIHVVGDGSQVKEKVDDSTENWPVDDDLKGDLDRIKNEFSIRPLAVFKDDQLVKAKGMNGVLQDALVEVHFELRHFFIRQKDEDSFNGSIEQIVIIQPGVARSLSPYKRRNLEEGPIHMNPTLVLPSAKAGSSHFIGSATMSQGMGVEIGEPILSEGAQMESDECTGGAHSNSECSVTVPVSV